jgi:putative chitinase
MITQQQLITWAPNSKNVAAVVAKWFNEYADQYQVNTPLRIAAFLAQVIHESGSFKYLRELASGKAYEGRKDLGNDFQGDGAKYKGRGYIQITGRSNYAALSKDFFGDDRLIHNPELLATPQYGMQSAFWFWERKDLNALADTQSFKPITRRINGGVNGFEDRIHFYNIICKDLGLQEYVPTVKV